jgi:hypothetical protein
MKNKKNIEIIDGYEVGNLTITIQAVPDKDTGRLIKGAFCTLWVKDSDGKEDKIEFVFSLDGTPEFKKHIISMINEAISLKVSDNNKKDGKQKTHKTKK